MPFIANEMSALKTKLSSIVVHDATAGEDGRPVSVYYELPETEVEESTYPHILIHFPAVDRIPGREHRGQVRLGYIPEGFETWATAAGYDPLTDPLSDSPFDAIDIIPVELEFHIEIKSRLEDHALQLISITQQADYLHPRFAFLDIEQDGTRRYVRIKGGPDTVPTRDRDGKRVFTTHYIIAVESEQLDDYYVQYGVEFETPDYEVYPVEEVDLTVAEGV